MIRVPPLRERREDIPLLIQTFLQNACARAGRRIELSPRRDRRADRLSLARQRPRAREHDRAARRLQPRLGHRGGRPAVQGATGPDLHERLFADLPSLDELERRYLLHVLEQVGGNRTRAAEVLGIDRRTLYRMAERFGIDLKEEIPGSGAA